MKSKHQGQPTTDRQLGFKSQPIKKVHALLPHFSIQLTLKLDRFEPLRSTWTWIFSTVNTTVPQWLSKAADKEPQIGKNFNTEEPPICSCYSNIQLLIGSVPLIPHCSPGSCQKRAPDHFHFGVSWFKSVHAPLTLSICNMPQFIF